MNILEKITAKQLLIIIVVTGYIVMKTEYLKDLFNSIYERFNISKKITKINSDINDLKNKMHHENETIDSTNNKEDDELNIKESGDSEDIFCNKKVSIEDKMLGCLLNKKPKLKSELMPINFIPYNYQDGLDNNILYSLNKDYKEKKLTHEKKQSGDVVAVNQKMIHKNFDKDIDYYKIKRRRDTILNLNSKTSACYINDMVKFSKNLKCFLRIEDDSITANWNIPVLPDHYFPKNINIAICRSNEFDLNKAEIYDLPFIFSSKKYESDCFSINSYAMHDRVIFNFKTNKNQWINSKSNCLQLSMKIIFFFEYYDKKHRLSQCFMESNVSNLL